MSRVMCQLAEPGAALVTQFSVQQLEEAIRELAEERHTPVEARVCVSACGRVCARRGECVARACVRARVSPSAPVATCALCVCAGGALQLRLCAGAAPSCELLVWFASCAACVLDVPVLAPRHMSLATGRYACDACARTFPDPNPLKLHLLLRCAPASPLALWSEVAARLGAHLARGPPPALLEALATEWGRGARGHACLYCGKLYSRRYGLKIHLRTHTGYRPLACGHCGRAFGDPSNLNKHVRLHRDRQMKRAPSV